MTLKQSGLGRERELFLSWGMGLGVGGFVWFPSAPNNLCPWVWNPFQVNDKNERSPPERHEQLPVRRLWTSATVCAPLHEISSTSGTMKGTLCLRLMWFQSHRRSSWCTWTQQDAVCGPTGITQRWHAHATDTEANGVSHKNMEHMGQKALQQTTFELRWNLTRGEWIYCAARKVRAKKIKRLVHLNVSFFSSVLIFYLIACSVSLSLCSFEHSQWDKKSKHWGFPDPGEGQWIMEMYCIHLEKQKRRSGSGGIHFFLFFEAIVFLISWDFKTPQEAPTCTYIRTDFNIKLLHQTAPIFSECFVLTGCLLSLSVWIYREHIENRKDWWAFHSEIYITLQFMQLNQFWYSLKWSIWLHIMNLDPW